jgi:hypothetical protein
MRKWCCGRQKKELEDILSSHDRNEILLAARPIDAEEAKQLMVLQLSAQATRERKQSLARYYDCKNWGICNEALDAKFLKHHPAYDEEASPFEVLHAALSDPPERGPPACRRQGGDAAACKEAWQGAA